MTGMAGRLSGAGEAHMAATFRRFASLNYGGEGRGEKRERKKKKNGQCKRKTEIESGDRQTDRQRKGETEEKR